MQLSTIAVSLLKILHAPRKHFVVQFCMQVDVCVCNYYAEMVRGRQDCSYMLCGLSKNVCDDILEASGEGRSASKLVKTLWFVHMYSIHCLSIWPQLCASKPVVC